MSVITLSGANGKPDQECVIGLTWETISKADWKARKKTLKSDGLVACEIPVTKGDQDAVNIGTIEKGPLGKGKHLSLASWVAHSFKTGTVIAVERVQTPDDGMQAWFCAVRDGQVVAGTDIVGNWDDIDYQVTEIVGMMDDAGDIGFIGADAPRLSSNTIMDAESLPLASTLPVSSRKKAFIVSTGDNRIMVLALVGGLVVAMLGAGGTWYVISSGSDADAAAQAKKRRIIQIKRAEKAYEELITSTKAKNHAGQGLTQLVDAHIGQLHTTLGGWALQAGECRENSCALTYKNNDLTDPSILSEGTVEVCDSVEFSINGVEATCTLAFESVPMVPDESAPVPAMSAAEVEQFRSGLMAYAKHFEGASYSINPASELSFSGSQYLKGKQLFEQGSWAMGFPVSQFPLVSNLLAQYPALSLESVKLNWGGKAVEIMGMYYKEGES